MKVLIVRHGQAEPNKGDDAARSLTSLGESQVSELWNALQERGVKPSRIVASPFKRTQQTAALIAAFYPDVIVETAQVLTGDNLPEDVFAWLQEQPEKDGLVLVSHMPLVAILTGQLTDCAQARLPFVPGMVACLDMEVAAVSGARLRWSVSPEAGAKK